jgi:hypothetical protein
MGLLWGVALLVSWRRERSWRGMSLGVMLAVAGSVGLGSLSGCGNSATNNYPTPAGSYPITLTSTATPQPGGTEPTQYAVNSISSSATTNLITLTTTNLTGITAGSTVTITNATPAAFNGVYQVKSALECDSTYPMCSSMTTQANTFTLPSTIGNLTGTAAYLRTGSSTNYSQTNAFTLVVK